MRFDKIGDDMSARHFKIKPGTVSIDEPFDLNNMIVFWTSAVPVLKKKQRLDWAQHT